MKFLLMAFDFTPMVGGIQTRAENYVKNLIRMEHNVDVIHILDLEVVKSFYNESFSSEGFYQSFLGTKVFRYSSSIIKIFSIFFGSLKEIHKDGAYVIHIISGANTPIGLFCLWVDDLMRAFKLLLGEVPHARLVIVGGRTI